MSAERITSFAEFWPYYLGEHRMRASRALHYLGTGLASVLLLAFVATGEGWLIPVLLLAGYGPAWAGHFFIEKNRPATFRYPLWSLAADYKMAWLALTGQLEAERHRSRHRPA